MLGANAWTAGVHVVEDRAAVVLDHGTAAGRGGAVVVDLPVADPAHRTAGMVHLAGGRFLMGAAPLRSEEGPPEAVSVAPFCAFGSRVVRIV